MTLTLLAKTLRRKYGFQLPWVVADLSMIKVEIVTYNEDTSIQYSDNNINQGLN